MNAESRAALNAATEQYNRCGCGRALGKGDDVVSDALLDE
jgi:hypothetical protein